MALAVWTDEQVFAQLNSGTKWTSSTITYAFATSATSTYTLGGEGGGFSALTSTQQSMAELALRLWDDLIVNTIQKAAPGGSYTATNIEFGNSTTAVGYAHAYFPGVGSVWFNNGYNSGTNNLVSPTVGIHGFATYIHEIGHAMGLEHMGDYNGAQNSGPSSFQDSTVYSIMSYYGPSWGTGSNAGEGSVAWADWIGANGQIYSPDTPMLNDIMAIQRIYGADMTTRSGDTVYGFSSNITGNTASVYNFTLNANPILCIWDGEGNDTLNLSGWSTGSVINLAPGSFSSGNSMTKNISIAYNCNIENAIGGAGNDTISGNSLNNRLVGEAGSDTINGLGGDDTLSGGGGSDTINGGQGSDTVLLFDSWANITWTFDAATATFTFMGANVGTDTITGVEFFVDANNVQMSAGELNGTETAASVITVAASQTNVTEGNSGTTSVTFTLTLDKASDADQSIAWAIAGTGANAASNADFDGIKSGTVTFAAGATEATITLEILGDTLSEYSESFRLAFTNATSGLRLGTTNPVVTITNDDTVPGRSVLGTALAEVLVGTDGNDEISGLAGNDILYGYAGDDLLNGGLGNDKLYGGGGNDIYVVDSASDIVVETATGGVDLVRAIASSYTLSAYVENLTYIGSGNFSGNGNAASNAITGGNGNDVLSGGAGNDTLTGNGGNDVLNGGSFIDVLNGGNGSDIYVIGPAGEHEAAEFADSGTVGVDEVRFASSVAGTLTLFAGDTGIERVVMGTGLGATANTSGAVNLSVNATALLNSLVIIGNSGANIIQATSFGDRIEAGAGNDVISGKGGNDMLSGGAGYDAFVFDTALSGDNVDTISDFSAIYDTVRLENSIFTALTSIGTLSADAFVIGEAAGDAGDRIIYNSQTGGLFYDADGAGGADAVRIATLSTGLALTSADFLVI